jgi:hypothetical protein
VGGYDVDYISFIVGTLFGIIFVFACVGLLRIKD